MVPGGARPRRRRRRSTSIPPPIVEGIDVKLVGAGRDVQRQPHPPRRRRPVAADHAHDHPIDERPITEQAAAAAAGIQGGQGGEGGGGANDAADRARGQRTVHDHRAGHAGDLPRPRRSGGLRTAGVRAGPGRRGEVSCSTASASSPPRAASPASCGRATGEPLGNVRVTLTSGETTTRGDDGDHGERRRVHRSTGWRRLAPTCSPSPTTRSAARRSPSICLPASR